MILGGSGGRVNFEMYGDFLVVTVTGGTYCHLGQGGAECRVPLERYCVSPIRIEAAVKCSR